MTPFDYINSISENKIYKGEDLDEYSPFYINRALSLFYDTILDASVLNMFPQADKKYQYDYYFYKLKKKKRFGGKWPKTGAVDENLKLIMSTYKYNVDRAKEVLDIFSEDDLTTLKEKQKTGGVKNE